jgi:phenylalanyl-tRNA synthetase alpha subunit
LVLKKESSPYNLTVVLRYSCGDSIKIGTKVPKKRHYGFSAPSEYVHDFENESSHIYTRYLEGFPEAIISMRFKNFSNRDIEPVTQIKKQMNRKNEHENSGTLE